MAKQYEVVKGIDYRGKRREPGAKVDDLTDKEARGLLGLGAITPAKPAKKGKD